MNRLQYLEEHHQLTESIIGLISIQGDFDGVKAVLNKWMPKIDEITEKRYKQICNYHGIDWEQPEVKSFMGFVKDKS